MIHKEKTLEEAIEDSLITSGGWRLWPKEAYDRALCLDQEMLFEFLKRTQPQEWEKLGSIHGPEREKKFLKRLTDELERHGTLAVLRNGMKDHGCAFTLAYFAPASGLNPEHRALYDGNLLSVARQLHYSARSEASVDIALFVNGLPVASIELKHRLAGQNVSDAIQQYRQDRDPKEPFFRRTLVHFAVDEDLVYMTTRLEGRETEFLPFNRGHEDGAGNPPNPAGFRSAYLWEEAFQKDAWLDLLGHFMQEEKKKREDGKEEKRLIFPRYHQWDAVRRLLEDAKQQGAGQRYLIQHSAGSGKSNTIAWLAHRLAELHDVQDQRVVDAVIVVTDRRILDRQLRSIIKGFEKVAGVVKAVERGSQELKEALEAGKKIITTTIQKFPYIVEQVQALPSQRFAILIDEAHSSQSGETHKAMNKVLSASSLEEAEQADSGQEEDLEDKILRELERTGMQANASYFAFTATPKAKTLEMFGRPTGDGGFKPFSLYTMRQAIEEKFILDVLQHYTTYKTYFNLLKKIEEDPQYQKRVAIALMKTYVDLHRHGIERKAEIMAEHFRQKACQKIGGKAKAIVVTRSRLHAVRYKQAFDKVLKAEKLPWKALVAFSGTVRDPATGLEYTESGMNGFAESQTAERFEEPVYRFLIVAEKFQTGFDQPLLHTMYVDKKLVGLHAVQTLSRLNRVHPEKEDCFVLDFANDAEAIQKAFEPYYRVTLLAEETDPNKLYDLERAILDAELFDEEEVEAFSRFFWDKGMKPVAKLAKIQSLQDPIVDRYRKISELDRTEFKHRLDQFTRLYAYLSQIVPFADVGLEKLCQFCRFLRRKLPLTRKSLPVELLNQINMQAYRVTRTGEHQITLEGEADPLLPVPEMAMGKPIEDEQEPLSQIIQMINEMFGTEFDEGDRVILQEMQRRALMNENLQEAVMVNSMEAVRLLFDPIFERILNDLVEDNLDFYRKVVNNRSLGEELKSRLFEKIYQRLIQYKGEGKDG